MFWKKCKEDKNLHSVTSTLSLEQAYIEGFNAGFNKGFELASTDIQIEKIKSQAIQETLKRLNGNL